MSAIEELKKVEILPFLGSKMTELPREIRNLSYLELLNLTRCSNLRQIPPGIMEGNKERANARLTELMSFPIWGL